MISNWKEHAREPEVFLRDSGPICISAELFTLPELTAARVRDLVESDFLWTWRSQRDGAVSRESPVHGLPAVRELTELTPLTADSLIQDCLELNDDGNGRTMDLVALINDAPEELRGEHGLTRAMAEFAAGRRVAIAAAIVQLEDCPPAFVFVPQTIDDALRGLLSRWNILPETIRRRRKYHQLRAARLESLLGID